MGLLNASIVAAVSHGLRMLANLAITKLVATTVGPVGFGVLGNFMSLTTMASVFAGGGISNGVVKYVSEFRNKPFRKIRFLCASYLYGIFFSIIFLALCIIFSEYFSIKIFNNKSYWWLFPCLGIAQLFCFLGTVTIAIANAELKSNIFLKISVYGYAGVLPFSFLLIRNYDINGAALAFLLTISCTSVPALFYILKSKPWKYTRTINRIDIKNLFRFSLMVSFSAALFPSAEIFIRTEIINSLGLHSAGFWQALNRLSGAYLGFFLVFLSTIYLPRISSSENVQNLANEVKKFTGLVSGAFLIFALLLYSTRHVAIEMMFSKDFSPIADVIFLQLIGDFFKLISYVIGFVAVAKSATLIYIFAEIIQTALYSLISWYIIKNDGVLQDIIAGYVISYITYFTIAALAFRYHCNHSK